MTDYLQCRIVTFYRGHVILTRVMAKDRDSATSKARVMAESACDGGGFWDSAVYPCGDAERVKGEGFDILYSPDVT